MAYSNFAPFYGTPALYASLPLRQKQRRTATNIMAGYFDPLPALVSDSGKDDSSSSQESIVSIPDKDDIMKSIYGREKYTESVVHSLEALRKSVAIKRNKEAMQAKGKQVKRVVPEEKENAISDSDTVSLSPIPPPSVQMAQPKASGFWRARSSNTPEGSSAALKRKHSSLFDADSPSPPPEKRPIKKSRLSKSVVADSSSPSSESLTSLDAESRDAAPEKTYQEKLTEAVQPHTSSFGAKHPLWVRCGLCPKVFEAQVFIEKHFKLKHSEIVAHLDHPPLEPIPNTQSASVPTDRPPEDKKRGSRKNVAVKKGWKGWVEEDLEPQKLILLDKPEVLPERTTRSGRKID